MTAEPTGASGLDEWRQAGWFRARQASLVPSSCLPTLTGRWPRPPQPAHCLGAPISPRQHTWGAAAAAGQVRTFLPQGLRSESRPHPRRPVRPCPRQTCRVSSVPPAAGLWHRDTWGPQASPPVRLGVQLRGPIALGFLPTSCEGAAPPRQQEPRGLYKAVPRQVPERPRGSGSPAFDAAVPSPVSQPSPGTRGAGSPAAPRPQLLSLSSLPPNTPRPPAVLGVGVGPLALCPR